jgi:hypothetical protein
MFSSCSVVGFCGSRSLPSSAQPLAASVVSAVLSGSSARLAVGCSVGADSVVLSSVPFSSLPRVSVFSAFGPGGRGACFLSAVSSVLAAARAGASIRWWSGGGLGVPLRLRLAARSVALVRFLARHVSPSGGLAHRGSAALVCFLSSPKSRGSLLSCRLAVRYGVPVFVFCVGFSPSRLCRLGRGSWVPVQVAGHSAFQWQPMPFRKTIKNLYETVTCLEYDPKSKKRYRKLRPDLRDLFTLSLALVAIVVGVIAYLLDPHRGDKPPTAQSPARVERLGSGFEELLLSFYDEQEAQACLKWLNKTSKSRLWQSLSRQKIAPFRIKIILSKRPYKTWLEVYYLPKVAISTIEKVIQAWRESRHLPRTD